MFVPYLKTHLNPLDAVNNLFRALKWLLAFLIAGFLFYVALCTLDKIFEGNLNLIDLRSDMAADVRERDLGSITQQIESHEESGGTRQGLGRAFLAKPNARELDLNTEFETQSFLTGKTLRQFVSFFSVFIHSTYDEEFSHVETAEALETDPSTQKVRRNLPDYRYPTCMFFAWKASATGLTLLQPSVFTGSHRDLLPTIDGGDNQRKSLCRHSVKSTPHP